MPTTRIEPFENLLIIQESRHLVSKRGITISIIQKLSQHGYIDHCQKNKLLKISGNGNLFLESLLHEIGYERFLEALFNSKHQESALEIANKIRHQKLQCISRNSDGGSGFKYAQRIYLNTKLLTHDNVFKRNPTQACVDIYEIHKKKYEKCKEVFEKEKNEIDKMKMMGCANVCTGCLFAALDAEITRWNEAFRWDEHVIPSSDNRLQQLFSELYYYIYKTPNPKISEVGFFSRVAIAYAMTGQLAKAEENIQFAFSSSLFVPECAELNFMFHMFVMILLFKYQEDPSDNLLKKLSHVAEIALRSLQNVASHDKRNFWMRMIILRKIFFLLGISNKIEIINGCNCTEERVNQAEDLLAAIENMGVMEKRREMFYNVAKARILECRKQNEFAAVFAERAIACDELGCFGETENVKRYLQTLLKSRM